MAQLPQIETIETIDSKWFPGVGRVSVTMTRRAQLAPDLSSVRRSWPHELSLNIGESLGRVKVPMSPHDDMAAWMSEALAKLHEAAQAENFVQEPDDDPDGDNER